MTATEHPLPAIELPGPTLEDLKQTHLADLPVAELGPLDQEPVITPPTHPFVEKKDLPPGFSYTSEKYILVRVSPGVRRLHHTLVWEFYNQKRLPSTHGLHHINEVKWDNRIENLVPVTVQEHQRVHSAQYKISKKRWLKQCITCKRWKTLNAKYFYLNRQGSPTNGFCRACMNKYLAQWHRDNPHVRQRHVEKKKRLAADHAAAGYVDSCCPE